MKIRIGSYQLFTNYFDFGFYDWSKNWSSMKLLIKWDLSIGWFRLRRYKTIKEMENQIKN